MDASEDKQPARKGESYITAQHEAVDAYPQLSKYLDDPIRRFIRNQSRPYDGYPIESPRPLAVDALSSNGVLFALADILEDLMVAEEAKEAAEDE